MKRLVLTFLLFLEILFSYADAYKMSLHEIIRVSDYCFLGEIIQITDQKYSFRIDSSYFQQSNDSIIEVDIKHYDCGHKLSKRVYGEKIILFLIKSNSFGYPFEFNNHLFLLNENEFPIINDSISYSSCDQIRFSSLGDFTQSIIEFKKNYSYIKNLFDLTLNELIIKKINKINVENDILIDSILNQNYKKLDVFRSIICDFTRKYNQLLFISDEKLKRYVVSTKINPFLIKNENNYFLIDEELGIISDSLSFISQDLTICRNNKILILNPKTSKKNTLYIVHHFKNQFDTIQIIEFRTVKSVDLHIDLKTNILYLKKGFNRYDLFIEDKSGIPYEEYKLLSCNVIIKFENDRFVYSMNSPILKNDLKEKIKSMKENDIIELDNIYIVDVFGNLIKIKPIKYKLCNKNYDH